ncbi:MAG: hypothetical protein KF812_05165 [Fimbriimonadaceae bacterium]|nr:hypothetical protein [Fimbriimonadaceae bacterium]
MVWSDPNIQALAKEFVPAAEEVESLCSENQQRRQQQASTFAGGLFQKFGEATRLADPQNWHEPGTKQGIYAIGPQGEYLGARFAGGEAASVRQMMTLALQRWNNLRLEKRYANKPVPELPESDHCPVQCEPGGAILRATSRDLPSSADPTRGRRFYQVENGLSMWINFTKWAWNTEWLELSPAEARTLQPTADRGEVPVAIARRIATRLLIDNVRGQTQGWQNDHVRSISVRYSRAGEKVTYLGDFSMNAGGRSFSGQIYGEGKVDSGALVEMSWVCIGPRAGRDVFNQREQDPGPIPMGVVIDLYDNGR